MYNKQRLPILSGFLLCLVVLGATGCASKGSKATGSPSALSASAGSTGDSAFNPQDPPLPGLSPAQKKEQEKLLHQKLMSQMTEQGSYYAVLAHADAYDKQWGQDTASRLLRADALRMTGQLDAAEKIYTGLLPTALRPRSLHGLSKIAAQRGQWDAARKWLDDAIRSAPLDASLYSDQGLVLTLLNRPQDAWVALRKSQELEPEKNLARANLALYAAVFDDNSLFDTVSRQLGWQAADIQSVKAQALRIKLAHHKKQAPDPDIFSARADTRN